MGKKASRKSNFRTVLLKLRSLEYQGVTRFYKEKKKCLEFEK